MAGAGRGGILVRVLLAAKRSGLNIKVYAIEKNPYAYLTLLNMQKNDLRFK
jgi:tRNA G37 N-methylase Trm5